MSLKVKPKRLIISAVTVLILILVNTSFASLVNYTYDDLNRLEKVEYEDGTVIDYNYDEVGNRTQRIVTITFIDSDEDGMPDSFENQYGLNPNDPLDAGYDNDSDGLTNLEEYQAGTVPTDPDTDDDLIVDGSDYCPLTLPVRIAGTSNYFFLLQTAYDNAVNMDLIKSHIATLTGDFNINAAKTVTLEGGYECDYATSTGNTTVIGNMNISDGEATIENFAIE
jgi:hypothetical protein